MAFIEAETKRPPAPQFADREALLKILDGIREQLDYVVDPSITPEMSLQIIAAGMRARGIDPDTIRYQQNPDDTDGKQP